MDDYYIGLYPSFNEVLKVLRRCDPGMPHTAYRIVEVDSKTGRFKTLFHGLHGSRELPVETWIDAVAAPVKDRQGRTMYRAGFNVLLNLEDCENYLKRFNRGKRTRELAIVRCLVRGLRDKPYSNAPVKLADSLFILGKVA